MELTENILITGAHGGLGIALTAFLNEIGFTKILTPHKTELNLLDITSVSNYFKKNEPTILIHLASVVFGLQGNLDNQLKSLSENTLINNNLFTVTAQSSVKKIFFAGTVASYPYPYISDILKEEHFFLGPPHLGEFGYAMSKRHAYSYLEILKNNYKKSYIYGIFTNLYGENDKFNIQTGHVIPSLVAKAYEASKQGKNLEVWGDGLAIRDFMHFKDAARAIHHTLTQNNESLLINISSNIGITIGEVSKYIANASKVNGVKFQSDKPVGITKRVVDNSKLKEIGFRPSITISDGLQDLCSWYAQNFKKVRN